MLLGLMNFLWACFGPRSDRYLHSGSDSVGRQDGLLWYKDVGQHSNGEFSMAVVQANSLLEDQSQIESGSLSTNESGPFGTFVGIYDGHGGPETSQFINDHLFKNLKSKRVSNLLVTLNILVISCEGVSACFVSCFLKRNNCISVSNGGSCGVVFQLEANTG